MLSIWALPVCGRGLNVCPDGLGQTFLQSKFLTFGVPKCLPEWFAAKKGPKCWEPRKMRLQLGEMVQIFSIALFSHSWDCSARLVYLSSANGWKILLRLFSQVGLSIISKRVENTPEIVQPGGSIISKRMKNTQHEKISILSKRMKNTQHEKTANELFTKLCTPRQHKQGDIFNFENDS